MFVGGFCNNFTRLGSKLAFGGGGLGVRETSELWFGGVMISGLDPERKPLHPTTTGNSSNPAPKCKLLHPVRNHKVQTLHRNPEPQTLNPEP